MAAPLFALEHVTVVRGGRVALDDLALRIEEGEHVAIVGPNGCGKSTLIQVLHLDLYPLARPETRVEVAGEARWNVFDLRRRLGLVSQDLADRHAKPWITVEAIALSAFFASVGVWQADEPTPEMRARARAALARVGMERLADRRATELSPGELRRALLARALVHEPRALLLDEPSTALDPGARHELRATLSRLAREGVALVVVTQDLADVVPEIARVVLLAGGRVAYDGPTREALTSARLSALFGVPIEVREHDGRWAAI